MEPQQPRKHGEAEAWLAINLKAANAFGPSSPPWRPCHCGVPSGDRMNRREVLFVLTLGALARPPGAEAQAVGKVYRVGIIAITPVAEIMSDPNNPFNSGFRREMRDRGYV